MAVKNYGIRDQWTNLDKLNNVDIKSVDGVIENVKINGEEAGGGGGCVVATLWQIDSSTLGVDGDFSAALAKVSQGIPIAVIFYQTYTASSGGFITTTYPTLCGVAYDSSSPDEIKIWYSSVDYCTWTENGVA